MERSLSLVSYLLPFLAAAVLSYGLTLAVRRFALRRGIVDHPGADPDRKIHSSPVPLLGGVAIFLATLAVTATYALATDRLLGGYLLPKHLVGMLVAGTLLMVGGYLDDRYRLRPTRQFVWPLAACLVTVAVGIGITYITNPFGGVIRLDSLQLHLFTVRGVPYFLTVWADLFAVAWLLGMTYTTKFLDGLDGLVAGISAIAAIVLLFLSISREVAQPETALLAAIFGGACVGFLILNFHPAKVFLGEGGSLFAGFMLGTLSIVSGAKIATALLIVGIPVLDVAWVIFRRLFLERKTPFSTADKKHLHFRLLDVGLSHRQAVLLLYAISLAFGGVALVVHGRSKAYALLALVAVMAAIGTAVVYWYRRRQAAGTVR